MTYDAFISYRHRDGTRLAGALERALERLGRRGDQLRALTCFRDVSDQGANADLDADLRARLDASAHFLLIATPGAAESPYVRLEIDHWLEHRGHTSMLIAVDHIDLSHADPWQRLVELFPAFGAIPMPKWTDFGAFADADLTLANDDFVDKAAEFSATISGRDKSDLIGSHLREARVNAANAMARDATFVGSTDPIEAVRLAGHAHRLHDGDVTRRSLASALTTAAHVVTKLQHDSAATAMSSSPDGSEIVTGHADGSVRRWHTADGTLRSERDGATTSPVTAIDVEADGRILSGHADGSIHIVDVEDRALLTGLVGQGPVFTVALDPDGDRATCGWENDDGGTQLVVARGTAASVGPTVSGPLQHLGFAGPNLVAISFSNEIEFDDHGAIVAERYQPMLPAPGPRSYRRDRRLIAQANLDGGDVMFSDEHHDDIAWTTLRAGFIDRIDFSYSGEIVAVTQKGVVSLFDLADAHGEVEPFVEIAGVGREPDGLAVTPDRSMLVTLSAGSVVIWSTDAIRHAADVAVPIPPPEDRDIPRVLQAAIDVAWSPDDTRCSWIVHPAGASGAGRWDAGTTIASVDIRSGATTCAATGEAIRLRALADGLAVTGVDGSVTIWDGIDRNVGAARTVRSLDVVQPNSHDAVAVVGLDGGMALWRDGAATVHVGHGGETRSLGSGAASGWYEGASGEGRAVFTGIDDAGGWVEVWDVAAGLVFERRTGRTAALTSLSEDGEFLALANDDGFEVVSTSSAAHVGGARLPGIDAIALDGRGGLLAAASTDGTITVFLVAADAVVGTLPGESDTVDRRLRFSHDATRLAEATSQGGLTVWNVDPARWRAIAERLGGSRPGPDDRRRYGLDQLVAAPDADPAR